MSSNSYNQSGNALRGTRQIRGEAGDRRRGAKLERNSGQDLDDENLRQDIKYFDVGSLANEGSQMTAASSIHGIRGQTATTGNQTGPVRWPLHDDDIENDVPASLLVEANDHQPTAPVADARNAKITPMTRSSERFVETKAQWEAVTSQQRLHHDNDNRNARVAEPRSLMKGAIPGGRREKALWRWVNISNLDSFIRDVYDYYEGGGLFCILCSNALWLL